jgi:hypothetical protein
MPTTDGRTLVLSRHTQPNAGVRLLLQQLKLTLPAQILDPPPAGCREDLSGSTPRKTRAFRPADAKYFTSMESRG